MTAMSLCLNDFLPSIRLKVWILVLAGTSQAETAKQNPTPALKTFKSVHAGGLIHVHSDPHHISYLYKNHYCKSFKTRS